METLKKPEQNERERQERIEKQQLQNLKKDSERIKKEATRVVQEITLYDDPTAIREHLHEMFVSYLLQNPDIDEEERMERYGSYVTLVQALKKMDGILRC